MTHVSGNRDKLLQSGALPRWVRAIALTLTRATEQRSMNRREFEQIARDLNLLPPELYGLLTGGQFSADLSEEQLATKFELSPQLAKRLRAIKRERVSATIRASLPIGPSCC